MANYDFVNAQGQANRELPGAQVNNELQPFRTSRYMEPYSQLIGGAKMHALSDEGTYFTATNATLGTAITGTAAPTAFSATVALMSLYNTAIQGAAGTKSIYLDYIRLEPRAAGTNGTNFLYAMSIDAGNRFASGGTAITPVNTNMGSTNATGATLNVGALTASAASASVRRASHGQLRSVIKVVGDVYLFLFGQSTGVSAGMVLEGTAQAMIPVHCPPIVLGPNTTFLLHEVAASQSVAATYEFSMGWWER
jgi:hypothetical protein